MKAQIFILELYSKESGTIMIIIYNNYVHVSLIAPLNATKKVSPTYSFSNVHIMQVGSTKNGDEGI